MFGLGKEAASSEKDVEIMRRILTASCIVAVLAAVSLTAKADEFYVGDPVMKNDPIDKAADAIKGDGRERRSY